MTVALLEARDVRVAIRGVPILHGADLSLSRGSLVALVGPNGAGKSTLARAVSGLQPLAGGSVRWDGVDVARLRGRRLARLRAFVPQRSRVPDGVTVRQAVAVGRAPHIRPLQRASRGDRDAVARAMERAGVAELGDRALTTLSGGELQRVQIAVALAQEAPVLIADEPASHLDLGAAAGLARMLRALVADGLGVLLVVHDLGLAAAVADEVVVMAGGRTVAAGAAADVLDAERLASVWHVDAALERGADGRSGLRVDWLGERRAGRRRCPGRRARRTRRRRRRTPRKPRTPRRPPVRRGAERPRRPRQPRGRRPDSEPRCARHWRLGRACRGARRAACGGPSCCAAAISCAASTARITLRASSACGPLPAWTRRAQVRNVPTSRRI